MYVSIVGGRPQGSSEEREQESGKTNTERGKTDTFFRRARFYRFLRMYVYFETRQLLLRVYTRYQVYIFSVSSQIKFWPFYLFLFCLGCEQLVCFVLA